MMLFSVMSTYTVIEDGLLAFITALYINSIFHLHPVFNIIIFFALLGAFYTIFEVLWRTVKAVKGWIFSIIYLAACWFSVYKGMPQIDSIWKTFFYVILVVFVLAARWTSLEKNGKHESSYNDSGSSIKALDPEIHEEHRRMAIDGTLSSLKQELSEMVFQYRIRKRYAEAETAQNLLKKVSTLHDEMNTSKYRNIEKLSKASENLFWECHPARMKYYKDRNDFKPVPQTDNGSDFADE